MEQAIRNFPKQFEWEPKIENADTWSVLGKYIICGMGGSHLQGDVFENEPKLAPGLAKLENVLLTSHIGSATKEAREKMVELAAENLIAVLENREAAR